MIKKIHDPKANIIIFFKPKAHLVGRRHVNFPFEFRCKRLIKTSPAEADWPIRITMADNRPSVPGCTSCCTNRLKCYKVYRRQRLRRRVSRILGKQQLGARTITNCCLRSRICQRISRSANVDASRIQTTR